MNDNKSDEAIKADVDSELDIELENKLKKPPIKSVNSMDIEVISKKHTMPETYSSPTDYKGKGKEIINRTSDRRLSDDLSINNLRSKKSKYKSIHLKDNEIVNISNTDSDGDNDSSGSFSYNDKIKIIILGAGIGGLAAAHELTKYKDKFDITVVERNTDIGGHSNTHCNIILKYYQYLLGILNEISDVNGVKIIKHIVTMDNFIYGKDRSINLSECKSFPGGFFKILRKICKMDIPKKDVMKIYRVYSHARFMCDDRLAKYDKILWKDYMEGLSPEVYQLLVVIASIYLGMNPEKVSAYYMLKLIRTIGDSDHVNIKEKHHVYVFDGPIDKVLFNPWKISLEKNGVKFLMEHTISNIYYYKNLTTISSIEVLHNNKTETLVANVFINAMDIQNLAHLYPMKTEINSKKSFMKLYENSKFVQTPVVYTLTYNVNPSNVYPVVLVLRDSPWVLMVNVEKHFYAKEKAYAIIMSCTIGNWEIQGLNGKNAINCRRKELAKECWLQIYKYNTKLELKPEVPKWDIRKSYTFNHDTSKFETSEPKFSNNVGMHDLKPDCVDKNIKNLYHACAYTKTDVNIFNVENAVDAGINSARLILAKYNRMNLDPQFLLEEEEKLQPLSGSSTLTRQKIKVNPFVKSIRYCDTLLLKASNKIKNLSEKSSSENPSSENPSSKKPSSENPDS